MAQFRLNRSDFNLKKNLTRLFKRPVQDHFSVIDGFRAIGAFWIISFHCVYFARYSLSRESFRSMAYAPELKIFLEGHFGIDIFFVISGFMITYLLLQEWKSSQKICIKSFYLRRFIRIMPAYLVALLAFYFTRPINGEYIWTNLLFINNYFSGRDQFMVWSWTIPVDIHFYLVIPFIVLFAVSRHWRLFITFILLLLIASIIIRYNTITHKGIMLPFPLDFASNHKAYLNFHDSLYDKTHTRYGVFLFGIIVAALFQLSNIKTWLETQHVVRRSLLILSSLIIIAILFVQLAVPVEYLAEISTLYITSFRHIFSLAFAYLLLYLLLPTGQKSFITKFLSAKCWYPIAQISFGIYLVHPIIMIYYYDKVLVTQSLSSANIMLNMLGFTAASFVIAAIIYLSVERPFLNGIKK